MTAEHRPEPIVPSRIIPSAPRLPDAPHGAEDLPPWRRTAPAPAPPPPPDEPPEPPDGPGPEPWPWHDPHPAAPIDVYVTVTPTAPDPEPEQPEPGLWSRAWTMLTARIRPWRLAAATAGAVLPIPWTGYSAATTWAYTVGELRSTHIGLAYAVAGTALALATLRFVRGRGLIALYLTVVTGIGVLGAIDWYDPITILTGVRR